MTNDKNKNKREVPDFTDEEFWREFNQSLWLLVKQAEPSPDETALLTEETAENLRKNECLSFERYGEIGEKTSAATVAEKAHLENCSHCSFRIAAFSDLVGEEKRETVLEKPKEEKISWRDWFFRQKKFGFGLSLSPLNAGLSAAAIILIVGAAFFLIQTVNEKQQIASTENAPDFAKNSESRENPATTNQNNESVENPINSSQTANNETKPENLPSPEKPEKENLPEKPIELAQLSVGEREAVRESLKTGKISLAGSDLAILQNVPVRRGNNDIETIKPISPKNISTIKTKPEFHWTNAENTEYQIIVTDRSGRKIDKSAVLLNNTWQISKELPAGFYFWQIEFRKKGEPEFAKNRGQTMFKVLSEAEKRQIETAVNSNESNLVRAIIYARAGLISEAENELNKKPISPKARKMLAQIKNWR